MYGTNWNHIRHGIIQGIKTYILKCCLKKDGSLTLLLQLRDLRFLWQEKFVAKLELQQHQGKLFILNMLEKPNGNSQLSDTVCKGILRLVESS